MKSPLHDLSDHLQANSLVEQLARDQFHGYPFRLENFPAGRQILESDPQFQRRAAVAMAHWLGGHGHLTYDANSWKIRQALFVLLKRKLPFDESDILAILDWSLRVRNDYWRGLPQIVRLLGEYLKANELSPRLTGKVEELIQSLQSVRITADMQRQVLRLNELIGRRDVSLPIQPGDAWADAALSDIRFLEDAQQSAWAVLLLHCLCATGAAPTKKWIKDSEALVKAVGEAHFREAVLRWFPLADLPRPGPHPSDPALMHRALSSEIPLPANGDILKGLAWCCGRFDQPEIARLLSALALSAYRRLQSFGPRVAKIGNACFWALGSMPSSEGIAQLSILKAKIKGNSAQKAIAAALALAAKRAGISTEEAEEIGVPTYGLDAGGERSYAFGDVLARIQVAGSEAEQVWERGGKRLAAAPKELKVEHRDELKEIDQTLKEIRKMLAAQRDRLDGLYLSPRSWALATWRERYLDHPIVGASARRLIWKFSQGDRAESGIWHAGKIVARDGRPLDWLDDSTVVELWHPIGVATEIVLAWREWLTAHEVQQPFKQAHREIYPLTDAERATRVYSNRYAAHILRQHQFNALCAARGWKNALRLLVDAELPPAMRLLPHWGLRAEFWVEGIGDLHDTNPTGTFLYLTTDQVRFYRSEATPSRAHAGGGGYYTPRWYNQGGAEPLPLESIPELVFSEIMRDVDLFVGVASVGNDPNWLDGGADVRYRDYWHSYSFGELNESARVRRQVLETLLPRMQIASRCELGDRFLLVRGDIRSYKIHLGSGNILMEPNDQYLCIVPARGKAETGKEKLFLPFEGDHTLAVILSKAVMLANDRKIADPTIVRQIKMK